MPLISVILPTFNRASVLARAVDSVARQSFKDWELVLVDDGSTDQTFEMCKAFSGFPLKYLRTENRGVSAARNLGAEEARGEWLAFLDSDDEWLPNKLAEQAKLMPFFRWIHSEEIWIRNGARVPVAKKYAKSGGRIFSRCVDLTCVSPSTVLIDKKTFMASGRFREDYPVCEDYDLWLRLSARFDAGLVAEPLIFKYGGHEDQLSRKFPAMDYYRAQSLVPFLETRDISYAERAHVAEVLDEKCGILLDGYTKHRNFENFAQVSDWRETARKAYQRTHSTMDFRPRSEASATL
jgi:glycosyltransferase involved in cell wall biosynthesis